MMTSKIIEPQFETFLVIGMGLTGYSIVRHLAKMSVSVCVADTRDLPPYLSEIKSEYPEVEIITGSIPYHRFDEFAQVVVSPGLEINSANDDLIIGDIELFARLVKAPVIAITGSNGKSTVTMLVSEMLMAAGLQIKTGGNIGTPALDLLADSEPDFYVLELSSFQLEMTSSLKPVSATILNISEDHMDRYADLQDYVAAKFRILQHAVAVVVNRSDEATVGYKEQFENSNSFGLDAPPSNTDFGLITVPGGKRMLVQGSHHLVGEDQITLKGSQNIENILSACALISLAGVELTDNMIRAASDYAGLPHRCEFVGQFAGVQWINDSKGTNVGATVAAICGIEQDIILIAGGKGKGADFSALAKIIKHKVRHTILFGEDANSIFQSLETKTDATLVASLDQAVALAQSLAKSGYVVLFSPACASFDMFNSYAHRGDVFKALVKALSQ